MSTRDSDLEPFVRDVSDAELAVKARWSEFVNGVEVYLHTYFRDQATTTVGEQQTTAKDVPGGVAAFRDEVYALVDEIASKGAEHFRAITEADVLKGWSWQHDAVGDRIVRPFGELFIDRGFSGGATPNHPGIKPDWYFYRPDTFGDGLQRGGSGMPHDHDKLTRYSEALTTLRNAEGTLEGRRAELDRDEVLDAWNNG
jgi:hypothetical protein